MRVCQTPVETFSQRMVANMELVLVRHGFEYRTRDGRLVSIKPDETYFLVSRTNQHWWQVRSHQDHARPFYVPAQYVSQLASPADLGDPCQRSPSASCGDQAETTPAPHPGDGAPDGEDAYGEVELSGGEDESRQSWSHLYDVMAEDNITHKVRKTGRVGWVAGRSSGGSHARRPAP
ncbi:rho GTPase-activating protein 27-like [Entelurus aequoreus]|uniref:rho GTPase-activating protein 27-like n=1 Tax=Entelurus aequoreus TaxID=161455 RepID=UPI002B1E0FDA|nr:rho GTPase-activating protein 27-like [Entelurus aequoreus]